MNLQRMSPALWLHGLDLAPPLADPTPMPTLTDFGDNSLNQELLNQIAADVAPLGPTAAATKEKRPVLGGEAPGL